MEKVVQITKLWGPGVKFLLVLVVSNYRLGKSVGYHNIYQGLIEREGMQLIQR